MADYKHTLNLPETAFPMRANLAQREPEILKFWQNEAIYEKQRALFKGRERFVLHDGPPYANGLLHVGHALNKTLKDIIVKSQQLLGKDSPYIPGWDCHGLPIEQKIEQKLGKPNRKVSASEFRAACRAFAAEQVELQKEGFKRLGVFADWDHPYLTMNFNTEAGIVRALAKIVEAGHVVRGFKPINWCFDCGSSLAEAEVEYQNKVSHSIDVGFRVCDLKAFAARMNYQGDLPCSLDIVIWTTTPWTLPANLAVALHADLDYVWLHDETLGRDFILAEGLVDAVRARWGQMEHVWHVRARAKGADLEGLFLNHPFIDRQVMVINGAHVSLDAGTGAVHTAPAHGSEDYEMVKKYPSLGFVNYVLADGVFSSDAPLVAGLHVSKAEDMVIATLQEKGRLYAKSRIEHSYPHCWRHKSPTIFRATTQWFISMDKAGLRDKALSGLEKVDFIPEWGKPRLLNMIAGRPDWCISRQRYWGVPLCFVVHKESGDLHPNILEIMEKAAQEIEKKGIEAWFALPLEDLIAKEDLAHYEKLNDVLDVWFDSGSTNETVLKEEDLAWPADLYLEGSDQHRGWFHSSLLVASAISERPPYRALLTHGFTVDEKGRKMSKSLGNVVDPKKVIDTLGADILRLWVASVDYSAEVSLSDNILKQRADAYRRIRNTCRFLLANLHDFNPETDKVKADQLLALDKYALQSAINLQARVLELYQRFEFHSIYQLLFNFCSVTMGAFYLDVIKDRQYTISKNAIARRSAQTAIYYILEAMVRWLAPILCFTAEELWRYLPGNRESSVFLSAFYDGFPKLEHDFSEEDWQRFLTVREKVNVEIEKARNEGKLKGNLEAKLLLRVPNEDFLLLSRFGEELHFGFIVSQVVLSEGEWQVVIERADGEKCVRCWHYDTEVGKSDAHPELCPRCIENIEGEGEIRQFL